MTKYVGIGISISYWTNFYHTEVFTCHVDDLKCQVFLQKWERDRRQTHLETDTPALENTIQDA